MTQSVLQATDASKRRSFWERTLPRLASLGQGSERPWDPTNRIGLMLLCLVLIVAFSLSFERFFSVSNAFTILLNITAIGIAAFGSGLLIISGNVDLSIGGQYALAAVLAGIAVRETQNPPVGVLTAIGVGAALGFLNGRLVRALKINPLIVTLAMASILRGVAYLVTGARSVSGFPEGYMALGRTNVGPVPLPVLVGATVILVGGFILLRTVFGLHLYAVGGNVAAARLAGVHADRLITNVYTINGALIGLVAALTTAQLGSAQAAIGINFELDVLTAVILGGVAFNGGGGHPLGILIGVVTIGVLNAGIIFAGVGDFWQQIVRGLVLLLALAGDQVAVWRREHGGVAPTSAASVEGSETRSAVRERAKSGARPALGPGDTLIACDNLWKSYGSVAAVRGVSFSVAAGEVVCLVGDNGAGKSTLIKMLSGAHEPDLGSIEVRGKPVQLSSPQVARLLGIQTAYQDLALCPNLGAAHNLVLGKEEVWARLGPLSIRDDAAGGRLARARLAKLGIELDDDQRPVRYLSGGQRQCTAIARIADDSVSVVILDEPTAALGVKQTRSVLDLIRLLADQGAGVILISHDIETVFEVADRVVVLRLGNVVHDGPIEMLTTRQLVDLMAGLSVASVGVEATA